VATHLPVLAHQQLRNDLVEEPTYRRLTAIPPDAAPVQIGVERPILHAEVNVAGQTLHLINVYLKFKIPTEIPGQMIDDYTWRTADAWAEGSFISSMKRMSQAGLARQALVLLPRDVADQPGKPLRLDRSSGRRSNRDSGRQGLSSPSPLDQDIRLIERHEEHGNPSWLGSPSVSPSHASDNQGSPDITDVACQSGMPFFFSPP
jgi:hypothetical protein